jgi:nucleotide-binding universal stress UspA family protein
LKREQFLVFPYLEEAGLASFPGLPESFGMERSKKTAATEGVGHTMDAGQDGRGGIKKLVLGSVAEEIADSAYCPVLTVGPHISSKLGPELKRRGTLYATDLLPGSARALKYALWVVEHEHGHLTLLRVLKMPTDVPSGYPEAERDTATKRLAELLPPETTLSVETEFIVEIGSAAEHILKVAEDQGADLIVMGPHRTSCPGISAHLPWATPHQVLCRARCAVLTVRDWIFEKLFHASHWRGNISR